MIVTTCTICFAPMTAGEPCLVCGHEEPTEELVAIPAAPPVSLDDLFMQGDPGESFEDWWL